MRSKSTELKNRIYEFVNDWKRKYSRSPSLKVIADNFGVSRTTIYRYLLEMTEDNMGIVYTGENIETRELNFGNMRLSGAKLVGSIPCGEAQEEEEYVEDYVNLPENIFGKGDFYVLRASGDSMEDAGISDGDMVVIKIQPTANIGDIVVALDQDNRNTLKRFGGFDENQMAVLEYMNAEAYPGKRILVKELTVQGVAKHIIKKL